MLLISILCACFMDWNKEDLHEIGDVRELVLSVFLALLVTYREGSTSHFNPHYASEGKLKS